MFDLSALVMLTLFNLIALVQIAANILVPSRLQRGPVLGAAAICLATSATGLAMAILVPSPVVGIASITIAALVNLCAVLGTGLDRLSDPGSTEALRCLRGLARLAIVGTPHDAVLAGLPSISQSIPRPRTSAAHLPTPVRPAAARRVPANAQATAASDTRDPLPRLLAAAKQPARAASRPIRPAPAAAPTTPASAQPLTPRQNFSVPRRPNRLPTSSLAFLLSVDPQDAPDIFADAHSSMSKLAALARRVSLVTDDPRRPLIPPQSSSVWPTTFSKPDPAWTTSYGRIPAVTAGV
jgi:hypothetical protein